MIVDDSPSIYRKTVFPSSKIPKTPKLKKQQQNPSFPARQKMKARTKTQFVNPPKPIMTEFPLIPFVRAQCQKSGFLEALPTALFYILQGFLSLREYHNLMNVNISGFQSIKTETIQYYIVLPNKCSKCQEKDILRIRKSVKNTSAQITMRFEKPKEDTVIRYAHLFDGIHKLILEQEGRYQMKVRIPLDNSFPIHVFDNIYHLKLTYITGIKVLSLDSPVLKKLEIVGCRFAETKKSTPVISFFVSPYAAEITSTIFPSFKGIPDVTINSWSKITAQSIENNSSFTYKSPQRLIPLEILQQRWSFSLLSQFSMAKKFI
jgi:hypothetical protein